MCLCIFWHFNVGYEFKLFSAHSKLLKVKAAHFASLLGVSKLKDNDFVCIHTYNFLSTITICFHSNLDIN